MKKALIICHDFPPLQSVGAQRPYSWFKYLPEFGIHPVVISRKWKEGIKSLEDKFEIEEGVNEVSENERSTLIKCIPKSTKRNVLISKYGLEKKSIQRKFLSARDQLLSLYNFKYDELAYLYSAAKEYLKNNKVDVIIVSAEPFILFKYANLLSEKFGVPWIADYRDEWRRNFSQINLAWYRRPFKAILAGKEKQWTSNSACFTTVSPPWVKSISESIGKNGHLIRNGIDTSLLPETSNEARSDFQLLFAGTLYDFPYLDALSDGLRLFIQKINPEKDSFRFTLVGIELNKTRGTEKFIRFAEMFKDWIEILPPVSLEKVIELESKASVCLNLVAGSISHGIYSVKLYEYLALKKQAINLESEKPEGHHEFSQWVTDCHSAQDFAEKLSHFYNQWKEGKLKENKIESAVLKGFDRKEQCSKLAEIINDITISEKEN